MDKVEGRDYTHLLSVLDSFIFVAIHRLDNNRIEDALNMRDRRCRRKTPPSTFEVLVALAERCETDVMTSGEEDRTSEWFWMFIHNLELDTYSDENWCDEDYDTVMEILAVFVNRLYSMDGTNGSLFPIPGDSRNHIRMQLWDQLQFYMWANFNYEWRYDNE